MTIPTPKAMYDWKPLEELAHGALVAVVMYLLSIFVIFDPSKITDWKVWAIALTSGSIRAAAGYLLSVLTKS